MLIFNIMGIDKESRNGFAGLVGLLSQGQSMGEGPFPARR